MGIEGYIFISILILSVLALIYLIIKKIQCKRNIAAYRKSGNFNQNLNLNSYLNMDENINNANNALTPTNNIFGNNAEVISDDGSSARLEINANKDIDYEIHTNGTNVIEDKTELLSNMMAEEDSIKESLTDDLEDGEDETKILLDAEDKTEILIEDDDKTEILISDDDKTEVLMNTEETSREKPSTKDGKGTEEDVVINEKKYIRLTNLADDRVLANNNLEDGLQISAEKTGKIVFGDLSVLADHLILQIVDREGTVFCIGKTDLYSVFINGKKVDINEEIEIYSGALLKLGNIKIKVEING